VLDLAEAAVGWMLAAPKPASALRALISGYQALRRLVPEELQAVYAALRFAAAREGARRASLGRPGPLAALQEVEALGEVEIRAAAGP
jgi:Ser/Thr protein kinase RdoA (MazF antagonist)